MPLICNAVTLEGAITKQVERTWVRTLSIDQVVVVAKRIKNVLDRKLEIRSLASQA